MKDKIVKIKIDEDMILDIPCGDEGAGYQVSIIQGHSTGKSGEIGTDDSGIEQTIVKIRAFDEKTGWESEFSCTFESILKLFLRKIEKVLD